jgi:hypothetical protein
VPNCGQFHAPSGEVYDLSPLTRPPTDPWHYNSSTGEQYYWNFCANLVDVPIPVELLSEEATAILISDAVYPIGHLYDYTLSELAPGAIQLSYSVSGKASTGKSTCPNGISRNSSIVVWCDKNTDGVVQSIKETAACSYTITMYSRHVCVGITPVIGVATEQPTEIPTTPATHQPTSTPTIIPMDETVKPTVNHVQPTALHPIPHPTSPPSPQSSPRIVPHTSTSSSSATSSGSKTITVVLIVLFVIVGIATFRRLRRRAHQQAHYLELQQRERQQQQNGSIPLSDIQPHSYSPHYPQQQQQMYYVPQQEVQQPPHPVYIPPLHQPFYMVAPQLTQQQQRQHLRQYQRQ